MSWSPEGSWSPPWKGWDPGAASSAPYDTTVLATTPTAYWKLATAATTTPVVDSSATAGNALTATAAMKAGLGGATAPGTIGGTAYKFKSGGTYNTTYATRTPDAALITAAKGDFSLEWFAYGSPATTTNAVFILGTHSITLNKTFLVRVVSGHWSLGFYGDTYTAAAFSAGTTWKHFVFTYAPSTLLGIFYVDGVATGTHTYSAAWTHGGTQAVFIPGSKGSAGSWNGALSRVAFYPKILTAVQVTAHYKASGL